MTLRFNPHDPHGLHNPRFVFFGTPEIARAVLKKVIEAGYVPSAVVTNPDRPVGRKRVLTPPPVKQFVNDLRAAEGVKIFQPEKLSKIKDALAALAPDFFLVAAYANLIPKSILDIPRLGAIGAHPSLLPRYRGPSPIQTAILDGAPEIGVTLYQMDEKMDEGPVIAQRKLETYRTGEKTNSELSIELARLGGKMVAELIPDLMAGSVHREPQNHTDATYTKKFTVNDAFVKPEELVAARQGGKPGLARVIHQKALAFAPEPGAWTKEDSGKRMKLITTRVEGGKLMLETVQKEGSKALESIDPMSQEDFEERKESVEEFLKEISQLKDLEKEKRLGGVLLITKKFESLYELFIKRRTFDAWRQLFEVMNECRVARKIFQKWQTSNVVYEDNKWDRIDFSVTTEGGVVLIEVKSINPEYLHSLEISHAMHNYVPEHIELDMDERSYQSKYKARSNMEKHSQKFEKKLEELKRQPYLSILAFYSNSGISKWDIEDFVAFYRGKKSPYDIFSLMSKNNKFKGNINRFAFFETSIPSTMCWDIGAAQR